jgi:archaellum component FlaC
MTDGDVTPAESDSEAEARSESIAEAYEEEAAMSRGPVDLDDLAVRVRKIEERLATIEDYLGTPPSKAGTIEDRIEGLEREDP